MSQPTNPEAFETLLRRLDAINQKLDAMTQTRKKSLEWMAQLSEHVNSLDAFREEVRASLEPLFVKLESIDDGLRILRHATSDVSRRVETLEQRRKTA